METKPRQSQGPRAGSRDRCGEMPVGFWVLAAAGPVPHGLINAQQMSYSEKHRLGEVSQQLVQGRQG